MNTQEKKDKLKELVTDMLIQSHQEALKNVDRALNSSAIDIDSWDNEQAPMILPKCIVTAILQKESEQYSAAGTSYQRKVKKEVRNIRYFI